jgi:hypothetical protein
MIPFTVRVPFIFVWDFVLFVLWIALFGIFGAMYIKEKPEGNSGIQRMKNAVVSDLFLFAEDAGHHAEHERESLSISEVKR